MEQSTSAKLPPSYRVALLCLAILGTGLILLITSRFGPGITPDSIRYINNARDLAASEPARLLENLPHELNAPLYPLLLAAILRGFGADPLHVAHIVNAILFGLIVYAAGILAFRILPFESVVTFLLTTAILVAAPLARVAVMAWTETLFILLVLLCLIFGESFLARRDRPSLLLFSLAVALAVLTRYIGITLILWGALIILLASALSWKQRARELLLFMVISLLPITLWLTRNYTTSGTLTGHRSPASATLSQNLTFTYNTFRNWYLSPLLYENSTLLIVAGVTAVLLVAIGIWRGRSRINPQKIGPILLFVLIYITFLIISSTTTAFDRINFRLLSPVYIPLTLLIFYAVWLAAGALGKPAYSAAIVAVFAVGFLFWSADLGSEVLAQGRQVGWGFNDRRWRNSAVIDYVKQSPPALRDCALYSNVPSALYIHTGVPTGAVPRRTYHASTEKVDDLAEVGDVWPEENEACLAWFNESNEALYGIDELRTVLHVEAIEQLKDGTIFRVSREK